MGEAHEVWEPVWLACRPNSAERRLLQALIQYANAALKAEMGRDRAAARLLAATAGHLRRVGAADGQGFMGVDRLGWSAALAAAEACYERREL